VTRALRRVTSALAFFAPALFLLGFIYGYPLVRLVQLSTQEVITYRHTFDVGSANFHFVLDDPFFRSALYNNLRLMLAVPILVGLSVLVGSALREQWPGWRLHRGLIFLPYVLPIPAIGLTFSQILRKDGILNGALASLGLGWLRFDWIGSAQIALWTVLVVIVWKELGFGATISLARLQAVDQELYEAARLDGASWWRQLRHVSLPELRQVLVFYVVLEAVTMMSWIFAYVYTLTGGGPANSTTVVELYLYQTMFGVASGGQDIGAAAAVGVLLLGGLLTAFLLASLAGLGIRRLRSVPK
jgi:ABC-type sugar transport system permease subunit